MDYTLEEAAQQLLGSTMVPVNDGAEPQATDPQTSSNDLKSLKLVFASQEEKATKDNTSFGWLLRDARLYNFFVVLAFLLLASHISFLRILCCLSLIIPVVFHLYVKDVAFPLLKYDVKWIKRESRLLGAILKDAAKVEDYETKLDVKMQVLCGFRYCEGDVTGPVAAWVGEAKRVVPRAERLVDMVEKQMTTRNVWSSFKNFTENELPNDTRQIKEDIIEMTKTQGINLCTSLEKSRSKIRNLLDRPLEHDPGWVVTPNRQVYESTAESIDSILRSVHSLKAENPDLRRHIEERMQSIQLQLTLLKPFLNDVQRLHLESEIETAWLEEAKEIVEEAKQVIDTLERSTTGTYGDWWPAIIRNGNATVRKFNGVRKFKSDMKDIEVGFSELFQRKKRYDFRFIERVESKSTNRFHADHAQAIPRLLEKISFHRQTVPDAFAKVHDEVTSLCSELERMDELLDDATSTQGGSSSIKAWFEQMSIVTEKVDRSITDFVKNSATERMMNQLQTTAGLKLSQEIDGTHKAVSLLKTSIEAYSIELREESRPAVGLEEAVHALVSKLTNSTSEPHHSIVSIVGIRGIGKTTMAKKIFTNRIVRDHFPFCIWITVTQHLDYVTFLDLVGKKVREALKEENARGILMLQRVNDFLGLRKCLIVLDDVPTIDSSSLNPCLSQINDESRILLTTSNSKAVDSLSSSLHYIRLRSKEESLRLFAQMVHISNVGKSRAKEFVRGCGGLPSSILCLGYVMDKKNGTAEELSRLLRDNSDITWYGSPLLQNCSIRIQKLPSHLRDCLYYFKLFKRNSRISARRLDTLWVAERLAKQGRNETRTPEEVAFHYLSELIDHNMVHVVKKKRSGQVKTCCLTIPLQELWSPVERMDQRLADHFNSSHDCFKDIHGDGSTPSNLQNYEGLISFLSFDRREGNKPGEDIGNFLHSLIRLGCLKELQVLDLEGIFRPQLPNSIGTLSKLRYLGLRRTYLENIPSSIGDLVQLETLDVKHTYVRTLPSSIWKLQNLRHLYLNQSYRSKIVSHPSGSSLKNLQTLWGVFVDEDSPVKDGLDNLINLTKLGLAFDLANSQQKPLTEWIARLNRLQSLRLRSIDEMGEPRDLLLEPFPRLENLSTLSLFGRLVIPSIIAGFPCSLTELTLSASFLPEDSMRDLERLCSLKVLCFYSTSFTGSEMFFSRGSFPQLLVLRLFKLELENWVVEEEALQNLTELEFRSCQRLNVPTGLRHLKSLFELRLTNMPKEFAKTIKTGGGRIWDDIVHSPSIIVFNGRSSTGVGEEA